MEKMSNSFLGEDALDDDISLLMADYSMPFVSGTMSPTHESLTQSQYGKVVFRDIADSYPTDSDVNCRYSLTCGVEVQEGDFVAIFRVGWDTISEALLKHPALVPEQNPKSQNGSTLTKSGQVLFRADALPKDEQEFYQLCYVTADGSVCGASVPFQFRRPHEEELCAMESMEDESEMIVVRSRTAVAEERLHKVVQQHEEVQRENSQLVAQLEDVSNQLAQAKLEVEEKKKEAEAAKAEIVELREVMVGGRQRERQVAKLQLEIQAIDEGRNQASAQLSHSQQHVEMLTSTVETLSADKARMAGLLRENVRRGDEVTQQLGEAHKQVAQLQAELDDVRQLSVQQAVTLNARHQAELEEVNKKLTTCLRAEKPLAEELAELRKVVATKTRQRQDLELLREHRATLEQQIVLADQRHEMLSAQTKNHKAKVKDLSAQVSELGKLLVLKERQADVVFMPFQSFQKRSVGLQVTNKNGVLQSNCGQCETAGNQISMLEAQVQDLHKRLDEGAKEYRKVYLDKCRFERKLAKAVCTKSPKSSSKEATPLPSPSPWSGAATVDAGAAAEVAAAPMPEAVLTSHRNCPMCNVTFPPGCSDLFTQHFENHLS